MTLSQEFKTLKAIAPSAVIKCVFTDLAGYKVAREEDSYEDYHAAITNMMTANKNR